MEIFKKSLSLGIIVLIIIWGIIGLGCFGMNDVPPRPILYLIFRWSLVIAIIASLIHALFEYCKP